MRRWRRPSFGWDGGTAITGAAKPDQYLQVQVYYEAQPQDKTRYFVGGWNRYSHAYREFGGLSFQSSRGLDICQAHGQQWTAMKRDTPLIQITVRRGDYPIPPHACRHPSPVLCALGLTSFDDDMLGLPDHSIRLPGTQLRSCHRHTLTLEGHPPPPEGAATAPACHQVHCPSRIGDATSQGQGPAPSTAVVLGRHSVPQFSRGSLRGRKPPPHFGEGIRHKGPVRNH